MERGGLFGEIPASPSAFSRMEACNCSVVNFISRATGIAWRQLLVDLKVL